MKAPLVSVNMAAYNAEKYISEAIQSVINQSFQDWELIIINDCSSDNTATEISKFKDKRIKVFHNEQNEGIVYTRNRALHYSQGKYVAVLDADDVFLPEKIFAQATFLEKNNDYALAGSAFRFIDENSKITSDVTCWYAKAEYFPAILLFNNFFVHSSVMFRTDLAKNILYKPLVKGCAPGEEYQLFVEIARTHKIYNINQELMYYRQHAVGISKLREDKINEYIDIIILNQLSRMNIFPEQQELDLHKSIRFAFDNLEFDHIKAIKDWMLKLINQNKTLQIYDRYFEEYLATKWYEIAKLNAGYGLRMLAVFYSSKLSFQKIIDSEKRKFLHLRCAYEFKNKLFKSKNA